MNEKILNGKLLTWTDKIFKQINIIEGTKNTMETKHDFTQGNILKKLVLFNGTDIWRTGFTGNVMEQSI